uniref:Ground-like domain-containing protein n=1 Tax=Steinernema glaseri TaxID=37863 RepID=A0A1I8ASH5_9BILA
MVARRSSNPLTESSFLASSPSLIRGKWSLILRSRPLRPLASSRSASTSRSVSARPRAPLFARSHANCLRERSASPVTAPFCPFPFLTLPPRTPPADPLTNAKRRPCPIAREANLPIKRASGSPPPRSLSFVLQKMRSLILAASLLALAFACFPSGVPNSCGCTGGSTCGACPPPTSFSQDAYIAPAPAQPQVLAPAPQPCPSSSCGYVAAPAPEQAPISFAGSYGSYVPAPPPPPLSAPENQYPTLIQPNYPQEIAYNSVEQPAYVDESAKLGYQSPVASYQKPIVPETPEIPSYQKPLIPEAPVLPNPQPQTVNYLPAPVPAPVPAHTPEPSQYLPEYEVAPSSVGETESKESYKPEGEEVFKAGRLDNYGTVPEYHVKATESVYDAEIVTEGEYAYTTHAVKVESYTEAPEEVTTQEYAAVLKEQEEEEKVDFNYMTYYNQVCTGETLGTSDNETTASAAERCALMDCAAANARPQGNGRYEVVFLRTVDGRLNQQGTYCVSGTSVPLRENVRADTNATSPSTFKKPKSVDVQETLSDAEMNAATKSDQVVGANGRRRSPMRAPTRVMSARFATVEPKSRLARIF